MDKPQINYTRRIKYTFNTTTGKAIRINTNCKVGERPGNAPAVFEVTDIPPDVTDQQVLKLYNQFPNDWFWEIGIYSYPYSLLEEAVTPEGSKLLLPTFKQHLEVIMSFKNKNVTQVIDYLATMLDKTTMTLWKYWKKNEAPRDTLIAINSVTHDILKGRLWTKD
ncbi:hypothetical protein [Akkermansia sp.]|uniref:hypothetical protein n=1 Tax=Akkermansia sp. TaxID=1872421 RepID=UPI0025BCEE0A|nr:hypothetical protein [Akkermansia sp.]MCD8064679.1 hypothetical protein [Akkermansia sp.]